MNFGELKTHVARNLGGRTEASIDSLIEDWINSCYLDMITRAKFPEIGLYAPVPIPELDDKTNLITAADTPSRAWPTDTVFIVSIYDTTNNQPIKQRDIRWYQRNRVTTTGAPTIYATYGGLVYWWPTPDDVYTMETLFRKKVDIPVLTQDTHVPVVNEMWHEGLILGATYRGKRSLTHPDADAWLRDWKNFIIGHSEQHTEEEEDWNAGFSIDL